MERLDVLFAWLGKFTAALSVADALNLGAQFREESGRLSANATVADYKAAKAGDGEFSRHVVFEMAFVVAAALACIGANGMFAKLSPWRIRATVVCFVASLALRNYLTWQGAGAVWQRAALIMPVILNICVWVDLLFSCEFAGLFRPDPKLMKFVEKTATVTDKVADDTKFIGNKLTDIGTILELMSRNAEAARAATEAQVRSSSRSKKAIA